MADDSATIKHIVQGGDYEGRTARGVQVTVVDDDDSAGLVLDKTSVTVDEGGSATFTVALATRPTAEVSVEVSSGDTAAATVSPMELTFTAGNWNTPQTVTVAGADDDDITDETLDVTVDPASGDTAYDTLADVTVDVTVDDDDSAGLVLDKTSVTVDEGGSATFTVALATRPTAEVSVEVSSGDTAAATVSPMELTFTAGNWNTPQTVTVAGADDDDITDETLDVTVDPASGDTAYDTLADVTVDVTVDDDDSAGLVLDKTSVTVDEGGSATFTVALATRPTAEVSVEVSSGDTAAATVSPMELTFTAGNWNTPQTVTVAGADDDDITDETLDVTVDPASGDTAYDTLADVTVDVTVDDDDSAGLVLDKTSVTVDEGGSATFTVALATRPTAEVSVEVSSGDTAAATVSPMELTFTAGNWNTPQTVTVAGADDDDITDETLDVTVDPASGDTAYDTLADVTVDVTVDDDDSAGLVLDKTSVTVDEGGSATFTVALATRPTAEVSVEVSSGDTAAATVSPMELTFTAGNWNTPQTVTVAGADDDDITDETLDVTVDPASGDTAYDTLADVTVDVTVDDDDSAGLVLDKTSVTVDEGGSATFTVALATRPTAEVSVEVSSGDTAAATVSPMELTFTAGNWNTPQTVTVAGADDDDITDETLDVTVDPASGDTAYDTLADVTVDVTVDDDDSAGLVLDKTSVTVDEGGSATFTVALATRPTAEVSVEVSSGDTAAATVSPMELTFTAGNWNTPQTVTVAGADDDDITDETLDVTVDPASGDTAYDTLADVTVDVTVDDDDSAGLVLDKTSVTVDEGGSATFTVALATRPTAEVSVEVSSGDTAAATVSPMELTFTAGNWNTPQTVTVAGADDDDITDETLDVTVDPASGDTAYDTLADVTVDVTVDDDDSAGLVLDKTSVTVDEGGSATFTVALATRPTAEVSVEVSSGDTAAATVSPMELTFTAGNWNTPQTVTVAGADDDDITDETLDVTVDPASGDTAYDTLADVTVDVTVDDDDSAGLVLDKTSVTVDEGGSATFTVALATRPTAEVSVEVSSGDTAAATVSPMELTFTAGNWNTPQTVTVAGADDDDITDETLDVTVDPASGDTAYDTLADVTVDVTVDDDDSAGLVLDKTSVTVDEGGSATFTVALATRPTAEVSVEVSSGDTAAATVSPMELTFTAGNWNTPQTVTVAGADDDDITDETLDVTVDPASGDTAYDTLADVTVDVTVDDDDSAGLVLDKTSVTVDEGGSATFTVALATRPTAEVSVEVSSGDTAAATVSPMELTFTAGNWNTPQTVTVAGADDDDITDETLDVTVDPASGDTAYDTLADVTVDVTVDDDDSAGLVLDKTSVTVDEGGSATFTVALATRPTAEVSVEVSSGDTAAATVSPMELTFTAGNWNTPQTVTVAGADDDDITDETLDVTVDPASGDTAYDTLADVTVDVTVDDDDSAGLVLDKTSVTVDEGGSATFTVALATRPTAEVSVEVSSGDTAAATVSPMELTFTAGNWNTPQTVTVAGADDDDITDETLDVTVDPASGDTAYDTLADVTVDVTVDDDDSAGLVLDKTSVTVDEGGSATFTVALATRPTAEVSVEVSSGDTAAATVSPMELTFTAGNWNTPQTVTVAGADDDDITDETLDVTVDPASGDTAYDTLADVTVDVTVDDDDSAGLVLDKTSVTVDEGGSATFTVALATRPTAEVSVEVSSGDTAAATVSPMELTFTAGNWNTPQTVTVAGADDDDITDETLDVTVDPASGDTAYDTLADVTVDVTVDDDDSAGLVLDKTSVTVDEGGSATFTVALATRPTAEVSVEVSSGDTAAATVSPMELTFTAGNWNTPQTVTVAGADDDDITDETLDVTVDPASGDTAYDTLADVTVDVTVDDDDSAGLVLDKTSVTVDEGGSATFTVALATRPTAEVSVEVSSGDTAAATVSPMELTFTAGNWNTPQTVTVAGADDDDITDETLDVTVDPASGDTAYDTLADVTVDVTVDDDDSAGLVLDKTSVTVDEGGSATFTVALATRPTAEVSVEVSSGDTAAATVSPMELTFTAGNWNTPQTVTVAGADDDDITDETLDVTVDPASGDTAYDTLADVTVDVTVDDDDSAGLPILSGITVWGAERLESEVWAIFLVKLDAAMSAEMTLEYATADGTARAGEDYVAKSGTLTIPAGVTSASVLVDLVEDAIAEDDETVVLRVNVPSDGTQQAISGTALIIDDDNVGVLDIGDAWRREAAEYIRFEVTLSSPTTNDVAVDYETADGTATAGQDYVATSGTLTIPAGELFASIKVALLDDSIDEIHERFTVELRNAENAYMGDSSGTGTIADGDPLPVMVVGVVEAAESEPEVELTVTLTSISSRLITADYITFDHTAVGDGVDYATTAGSLRFEPGETHKTIRIPIVDDDLNEGDETFTVILKNIKNARRGDRSHSVTILDDDGHSVSNAGSRTTAQPAKTPETQSPDGPPDTPRQPQATAVFIGGVDLEWDDVPGADSYDVQTYRGGRWVDLPGDGAQIAFYGAGAIISGLDPQASLLFQVRAANTHGVSDWSPMLYTGSTSQFKLGRQARPANTPASGAPVIVGTAQPGQPLWANTTGIEDDNGLDRVRFRYQWMSNDGSGDADIAGATQITYQWPDADEANTVSVRVTFTDRGGSAESLTSPAVGTAATTPPVKTPAETTPPVKTPAETTPPVKTPATGAPTINGTAQVGQTLTADTSNIADSDGLANVVYQYQWLSDDGSTVTEISGATGSTYTLQATDEGAAIKVQASFADDADNQESLTSSATNSVAAPPLPPLTGNLRNTPQTHDGQTEFSFELRFSEQLSLSYKKLKLHAFTVTGGTVQKAQRIQEGSNIRWRITVAPNSNSTVNIILPATTNCGASSGICTNDGRKFSSPLELTVSGPSN